MNNDRAYNVERNGKKTITTSIRIDHQLWELVKLSGKHLRPILESAILREFEVPSPNNPGEYSDQFRIKIREALEEEIRRAENTEKRAEIIKEEIERARAKEIAEVLAAAEIERREQDREETHRRKLEESWSRVAESHYLTPSKIRKWLPENDRNGDHIDEWEKLPVWLNREGGGETFTTDEILTYAKQYAGS